MWSNSSVLQKTPDKSLVHISAMLYASLLLQGLANLQCIFMCTTCRSYAVDEYRKPFWEVFGSYLEDASSVAGEQMMNTGFTRSYRKRNACIAHRLFAMCMYMGKLE